MLNSGSSVFFATFAPYENNKRLPTNGMVEPMLSFFLPRIRKTLMIIQPHPGSDRISPIVEIYEKDNLKQRYTISALYYFPIYLICKLQNTVKTHISFKLRDLFSVLITGFSQKDRYDFFIGLEGINTLGGIILKRLGKVRTVIYYVSDYSPHRFGKTLFNGLYVWLDRFCAINADFIWDVSLAMQPARIKAGLNPKKSAKCLHVPNGLFATQIKALPIEKRMPFSLVFLGTLGYENGPDLAIESLIIIKKKYPKVKLHIVGGGKENLNRLKNLVEKLQLKDSVIFYGFIVDNNEMAGIIRKCYIALAPYRAIKNSIRWYADATKIRQYMASGLPIITTHVPPLGKQIVEKGAGIMIDDSKEDLAKAAMHLFTNSQLYDKVTQRAIALSKNNTWENIYKKAFNDMDIK
ncbi:MAG: glycosyltransferase [Candidatus Levybacteria bacterium]|nr:glycosyltransferase [Candidatus Levybacteria bacterium]